MTGYIYFHRSDTASGAIINLLLLRSPYVQPLRYLVALLYTAYIAQR